MERFLMDELLKWKNKSSRKPLIIRGARQVGKTWLMKEFGKRHYQNVVYINFDNNVRMRQVFEMDFDISRIVSAIKLESKSSISPEDTLLIFDEIQEAPKALACLKYFQENAPEYQIICAGSLLGVALHEGTSFPVGKVEFLDLHPLTYQEFLCAVGEGELANQLRNGDYALTNAFSEKYIDLLKKYFFIGGMPEVVSVFVETDDFYEARNIQNELLSYYENDFSKHAPQADVPRIHMVWDSVPMQLAKENKKFMYGCLREGARAKEFEMALQWLLDCGLIHKSYRVKKPGMPLAAYMEMNIFKIYCLDVGLLLAKSEIPPQVLLNGNEIFTEFKGAMTEQFVAQELSVLYRSLYYYSTENSSGEIDFLLQIGGEIAPLEVKAEENLQAKSLRNFCMKYKPGIAFRTSMSGYREQEWMTNVPLYLLSVYLNKNAKYSEKSS